MPVYNREQYLKESIESILDQTFTDFEFIIVDDQSTDSSWSIIQEYANKDSRIVAVKNTGKKGCPFARNCGNRLAKGKYIAVMDSDDISLLERLQTQFDFMEKNPGIDICGSWSKIFGISNNITKLPTTHDDIRDQTFFGCAITNGTAIYRTNLNIEYPVDFNDAEDYELWCRTINKLKFANIPAILLLCRTHNNQTSTAKKKEQTIDANKSRLQNLKGLGLTLTDYESRIYCDFFAEQFIPQNINEIICLTKIFEKISIAGNNSGYGKKFQEIIKNFIKNIAEKGIQNKVTSLKLYFTTFRKWKIFETPRANLRYLYHCLKNIWR